MTQASTLAAAREINIKLSLLLLLGNLFGAVLTFLYFRFVDFSPSTAHPITAGELAFFVVGLAVLGGLGVWRGRHWARPLLQWTQERAGASEEVRVRRRALLLPYRMARFTLTGWFYAGFVWGVLWPLLTGMFYIGDEIEAVFGAPLPHPRHPELAVRAALEMRRRLAAWNRGRSRDGRPVLRHGIGIHTGRVLAGNIGSPDRPSWTLVGDPVNVAARLQALNKDFGSDISCSRPRRPGGSKPRRASTRFRP